jgi:hypothetical protein
MRAAEQEEPMAIAVLTNDDEPVSAVKLTAKPVGAIKDVSFVDKEPVEELEDFGYKISLVADWNYGKEYMHLYLDESLKIRFYFVSW